MKQFKIFFAIGMMILGISETNAQKFGIGFGFDVNQTRFRQTLPAMRSLELKNAYRPCLGMGAGIALYCKLNKKFTVYVQPSVSIFNLSTQFNTDTTTRYPDKDIHIEYVNLASHVSYNINRRIQGFLGVKFSGVTDLSFRNKKTNALTVYESVENKYSFNPYVGVNYYVGDYININLNFTYFTKYLYITGALDKQNNIRGPVEITPYVFSIGLDYRFDFSEFPQIKKLIMRH